MILLKAAAREEYQDIILLDQKINSISSPRLGRKSSPSSFSTIHFRPLITASTLSLYPRARQFILNMGYKTSGSILCRKETSLKDKRSLVASQVFFSLSFLQSARTIPSELEYTELSYRPLGKKSSNSKPQQFEIRGVHQFLYNLPPQCFLLLFGADEEGTKSCNVHIDTRSIAINVELGAVHKMNIMVPR